MTVFSVKNNLFTLNKGEKAKIISVGAQGGALARLTALGVIAGAEAEVLAYSLFKSSVLISCGAVRVALRKNLAAQIAVEKI